MFKAKLQLEDLSKKEKMTSEKEAAVLNNLGIAYLCMGDYQNSEHILKRSTFKKYLDQAESINNSVLNSPVIQIRICEMRAVVYEMSGNMTEWENQIREGLSMLENSGLEKSAVAIDIYVDCPSTG